jgi:tetratricopeptide (TPR) repeat protein
MSRKKAPSASAGGKGQKPTISKKPRKDLPQGPTPPTSTDFLESGLSEAQNLVYDGWELFSRDPRGAKECFREAIELAPDLADAYNGLAELARDEGRLKAAEALYRTAHEKAKSSLGTEDPKAFAWWGELDTRPYMRARHGLGMVFMETQRYREAVAEFKDLLKRNPNDNQGIRYLVAPAVLLAGDIEGALGEFDWYKRHYPGDVPDPHFLLNWALALFLAGKYEESALRFRGTIFMNPYLIPLVLGKKPRTLPMWHPGNLMELDYAYEYFDWYEDLWTSGDEVRRFLRFIWDDREVRRDYREWVELWRQLNDVHAGPKRSALVDRTYQVRGRKPSPGFLMRLREHVAAFHEPPGGRLS